MSPIVIDDRPRCPMCGHLAHVQPTDDGTVFYEPDEAEAVQEERAAIREEIVRMSFEEPISMNDGDWLDAEKIVAFLDARR